MIESVTVMNCAKFHESPFFQIHGPQILNYVYVVVHRPQIFILFKILDPKYWHGPPVLKVREYPPGY